MNSPYEDLIQRIASTGISSQEAEFAARRCAIAMLKGGSVGYTAAGVWAYFLAMNPVAAAGYLASASVAAAGYQLATSPQCSEVREAISFWNTAAF
jgi:hypothetical protein